MDDCKRATNHYQSYYGSRVPELIAPAGNWECLHAAIAAGADAVYFGLDRFNARLRASNFKLEELPQIITLLHLYGLKGYLTLNTLIFPTEFTKVAPIVEKCVEIGIDAIICQDVGLVRFIREISPDIPIHASTQMTISSIEGILMAWELGCKRVTLARELSISEIEKLKEQLTNLKCPVELEVFIHGALCISYSGICFASRAFGGRSANRGECAQACRLPYKLIVDDNIVELDKIRYLLSPKDLCGWDLLPKIAQIGVNALKIEGRLKPASYVVAVVSAYRKALNSLKFPNTKWPSLFSQELSQLRYELEMAFSRGLGKGWLEGVDSHNLVHGLYSRKQGILVGYVLGIQDKQIFAKLNHKLKPGDGLVLLDPNEKQPSEIGGRIFKINYITQQNALLTIGPRPTPLNIIKPGMEIWKSSDPQLERKWNSCSIQSHKIPLRISLIGEIGHPLSLTLQDNNGYSITVSSSVALTQANKHPLSYLDLKNLLNRLGNSPFILDELNIRVPPNAFIPASEINRLRRNAIERLITLRTQYKPWTKNEKPLLRTGYSGSYSPKNLQSPQLIVMVRSTEQLLAAVEAEIPTIYLELEDLFQYKETIRFFREIASSNHKTQLYICPPRITKPGEEWMAKVLNEACPDGFVIRNPTQLEWFKGKSCVGDYTLNVANQISLEFWTRYKGLRRVTISYDISLREIMSFISNSNPLHFEIVIHHHMPIFYTQFCPMAAFIVKVKGYPECKKFCRGHNMKLLDRKKVAHPIRVDSGCRLVIYNGIVHTMADSLPQLIEAGACYFRVEFVDETKSQCSQILNFYQQLLKQQISPTTLWENLKTIYSLPLWHSFELQKSNQH